MTVGPLGEDGFTPGELFSQLGVHDAGGSLPNLYRLDREFVEELLKDLFVRNNPNINNPLAAIFNGLRSGISFPLAIIEAIVNRLLATPSDLFFTIEHALDQVGAWRNDLMSMLGNPLGLGSGSFDLTTAIQDFINNTLSPTGLIATLLGGQLTPGQEPQSLLDTWQSLWANVFNDHNPIIRTVSDFSDAARSLFNLAAGASGVAETALSLINFPTSQTIWGHTNPTMQVSISLAHLRKYLVSGSTVTTSTDPDSITVTAAASSGAFTRFDKARDADVITFKAKASGTIDSCKVHVWRMDTATGDISWVRTTSIVPASLPTTAFGDVYAVLPAPVHVDAGTVLGGEVAKVGSGTLQIAGIDVPWQTDDLTARPKRWGFTRNSGTETAPPASVPDISVTYSTKVPYLGFGQVLTALPPAKYLYADGFNSTTNWKALAGTLNFSDGLFRSGSAGPDFALFTPAVNTDRARIEFDVRTIFDLLTQSFQQGDVFRVLMFCTTSGSQWVGVEVESKATILDPLSPNADVRIVSGSGLGVTRSIRSGSVEILANTAGFGGSVTRCGFEYDDTTKIYRLDVNNNVGVQQWFDSGNLLQHGPGYRQAAIYAAMGQSGQQCCDNFVYKDV